MRQAAAVIACAFSVIGCSRNPSGLAYAQPARAPAASPAPASKWQYTVKPHLRENENIACRLARGDGTTEDLCVIHLPNYQTEVVLLGSPGEFSMCSEEKGCRGLVQYDHRQTLQQTEFFPRQSDGSAVTIIGAEQFAYRTAASNVVRIDVSPEHSGPGTLVFDVSGLDIKRLDMPGSDLLAMMESVEHKRVPTKVQLKPVDPFRDLAAH